jgi:tetratricopeptide (TPR) repeat protein
MALPHASQRQRYFKERIVGKPISHANFRLAHLLSEKRLATLLVTPNFDDFLPRAAALLNKGASLRQLNRPPEAIQAYDEVLRRFGEANEPAVRERVAWALLNKGIALGQLKRGEEELQTYNEVLRRFGNASEPAVHEQVAKALFYKGLTLGTLERPQEAGLSFKDVLSRFTDSPDGAIQQLVEKAKAELKSLGEINP